MCGHTKLTYIRSRLFDWHRKGRVTPWISNLLIDELCKKTNSHSHLPTFTPTDNMKVFPIHLDMHVCARVIGSPSTWREPEQILRERWNFCTERLQAQGSNPQPSYVWLSFMTCVLFFSTWTDSRNVWHYPWLAVGTLKSEVCRLISQLAAANEGHCTSPPTAGEADKLT